MSDLKISGEDVRAVQQHKECWYDLHKLHERREWPGCCPFCADELQTDFEELQATIKVLDGSLVPDRVVAIAEGKSEEWVKSDIEIVVRKENVRLRAILEAECIDPDNYPPLIRTRVQEHADE